MRKYLHLFALLLPILALGIHAANLSHHRANATEYTVVVEGYDPRDLVYGKYVQFRYVWDDPKTTYPDTIALINLPISGRFYTPEHDAYDLQAMIQQPNTKRIFTATVTFMGQEALIKDLQIDGQGWKEALDAFRQNPDNTGVRSR